MFRDVRGLEVTAASEEAVGHLDATIRSFLGFRLDTGEHLKRTLAADPEMPLALAVRGCFMHLFGQPALLPKARACWEAARAAAGGRGAGGGRASGGRCRAGCRAGAAARRRRRGR